MRKAYAELVAQQEKCPACGRSFFDWEMEQVESARLCRSCAIDHEEGELEFDCGDPDCDDCGTILMVMSI